MSRNTESFIQVNDTKTILDSAGDTVSTCKAETERKLRRSTPSPTENLCTSNTCIGPVCLHEKFYLPFIKL